MKHWEGPAGHWGDLGGPRRATEGRRRGLGASEILRGDLGGSSVETMWPLQAVLFDRGLSKRTLKMLMVHAGKQHRMHGELHRILLFFLSPSPPLLVGLIPPRVSPFAHHRIDYGFAQTKLPNLSP